MSTPAQHSVKELAALAARWLGEHGCASPRLDADLLLAHILGRDRLGLWLIHDMPVDPGHTEAYRALLKRRQRGEPVAYILGVREFYGRPFRVSPACLIPRPETEHVVDAALECLRRRSASGRALRCIDLGTGSGCIAVTLALEAPGVEVVAVDKSADALSVAAGNAQALGAHVRWIEGDMIEALNAEAPFDLVVSNPPYITDAERASLAIDVREHEPALALFSGTDPLAFHQRILSAAESSLERGGAVVLELGALDASGAARLPGLAPHRKMKITPDLAGIQRVLVCE